MQKISHHSLIQFLFSLKGNPRICVFTEPLWGIPYYLFMPFATVYMSSLGVTDIQIGLLASLTIFVKALGALLSGSITDKMGRRNATFLFDVLSWSVPCFLWMFSQSFAWFLVAALFNGLVSIPENAWMCLLVEDAENDALVDIFNLIYIAGQLCVFFAPITGFFLGFTPFVTTIRFLYGFSFISMTLKFVLLYRYGHETKQGALRMAETKGVSVFRLLSEYKTLAQRFFASDQMRLALSITLIFQVTSMVVNNFFGIYTTKTLLMKDQYLAFFPILRSAIFLIFIFGIQPRLKQFSFRGPMLLGIAFYFASQLVLLVLKQFSLPALLLYVVLEACASGLVLPRKDSMSALLMDPKERARMSSILAVTVLLCSMPFGYIAGSLSEINRRLPFLLNALIYICAFGVILWAKPIGKLSENENAL